VTVKIRIDPSDVEAFAEALKQMSGDLRNRFADVLGEIGRQIVMRARAYAPVRTGALRASIYSIVTRDLVLHVGAYVYYAMFQEYGTRYIAPRYFLTRAIQENLPLLTFAMQEAIGKAWESL
jgi:HK97 gp10 family phage protein